MATKRRKAPSEAKAGRPARNPGQPRRKTIQVMVSEEEKAEIQAMAEAVGESPSTYCYTAAIARLAKDKRKTAG